MSEEQQEVIEEVQPKMAVTLQQRLTARREELERRTTEIFPVPLFDEVLAVELKAINWKTTERIVNNAQRSKEEAILRGAGDEIVAATVGFHEIGEQGVKPIEGASSWREIAQAAGKQIPAEANDRVALMALCTDQGVIALNATYRQWLGGADVGISKSLSADF